MSFSFRCANLRTIAIYLFTLFFFVSLSKFQHTAIAQDEDPLQAVQLFEAAFGLQEANKLDRAAVQYARIINQYPEAKVAAEAHYQLGICQFGVGKYKLAATNFDSFLQHKQRDTHKTFIPYALYNLGLSCYEIARNAEAQDATSVDRAIKAFDQLEKDHSKSELVDQGIFFRSQARFLVNDLEGAVSDLKSIVENHPKSSYYGPALIDLGTSYAEMGKHDEATKIYDQFLENNADDPAANEVKLRRLDCRLQMALKDQTASEADSTALFKALAGDYTALAQIDGFELAFHALQQQAFCLARTGAHEEAAAIFENVANKYPDLADTRLAKLNAARNYESAGNDDKAVELLESIAESQPELAIEASWMLCSIDLKNQRYQEAYRRAGRVAEQAKDTRFGAPLLFIQAQAAFQLPGKVDESTALFKKIASDFGDEPIAIESLYNAAFNQLQKRETADVHQIAATFKEKYSNSSYYPEVIELNAEALLLDQDQESAQNEFQVLVDQFPEHSMAGKWILRLAETMSLRGKNEQAISVIQSNLEKLKSSEQKANAYYLLGLSQFNSNENQKAAESLRQSIEIDDKWKYASAVQLLRARTAFRLEDFDSASQMLTSALSDYPEAINRDEMLYRSGQIAEAQNKLEEAALAFQAVISRHAESSWIPESIYKLGWVKSKQNDHGAAAEQFTKLIDQFPKHQLVTDALLARGISHRLAGNITEAITDLKKFLSTADENSNRPAASYELALAYAADGKNREVIETLLPLLEMEPKPKFVDDIHYELGWAYRADEANDKSIEQFRTIVNDYPESPHAAEANFHVAESMYDQKDYEGSSSFYATCIDNAKDDSLKEKAAYKSAWAHYHQNQYNESYTAFEKQVNWYPNGALSADGKFMMAESRFRLGEYGEALKLYKTAIPALDESKNTSQRVKRLARLHGAQSANKTGEHKTAVTMATELTDDESADYYYEGYYELGDAHHKSNENEKAKQAWAKSALVNNKIGARSNYMLGEVSFGEKDYDAAIGFFELVVYRYGGTDAPDEIKVWQALSAYEIARCYHVRIKAETDQQRRSKLIKDAISSYQYVIDNYASNKDLLNQSQKAVTDLKRLQ